MVSNQMVDKTGWQQLFSRHRFCILLALLVGLLTGSPILFGFGLSALWFDALLALIVLAAIVSLCFEPRQRRMALSLGLPTIIICLGGHAFSEIVSHRVLVVGHLCGVLFFFGSSALIVYSLFESRSMTLDSVFGAVCGYLFLGMGWAMAYAVIETLTPGSFRISENLIEAGLSIRPQLLTYYSFVTLTTMGYGDITPQSAMTCTLAWAEAMTGQFYLAIVVASLVSLLITNIQQNQQDRDSK